MTSATRSRPGKAHLYWLALLIAAASYWLLVLRPNMHEVVPGEVYRSAQLSEAGLEAVVQEYGIRSIINLRPPRIEDPVFDREQSLAARLGLDFRSIGLFQGMPRIDQVLALINLIEHVERPYLVHCRAGADRTGLAVVLELLLRGEQSLDEIEKQAGWRYGAVRSDSAGRLFLDTYRRWLSDHGSAHSPKTFSSWVNEDFVDGTGNIHFLVHPIRGQVWYKPFGGHGDDTRFHVDRADNPVLELDGWAYDGRQSAPLEDMRVFLGGQPFDSVEYGNDSAWLKEDVGSAAPGRAGFTAEKSLENQPDGCFDLTFEFQRSDGTGWQSPPAGKICVE